MCLISLHHLYRPRVKKASRLKMIDKKFLKIGVYRLDNMQTTRRPLTPTFETVRALSRKKIVKTKPASTQTYSMKLYRHFSQQQSTVALKIIIWTFRRRQVNDSNLLEMLAVLRGTAMLPLIPSSNPGRADIELSLIHI